MHLLLLLAAATVSCLLACWKLGFPIMSTGRGPHSTGLAGCMGDCSNFSDAWVIIVNTGDNCDKRCTSVMAKCYVSWPGTGRVMYAGTTAARRSVYSIYTRYLHTTVAPDTRPRQHYPVLSPYRHKGSKWCCETPWISDKWSELHFYNTANKMKIAQTKVSIVRNWKDDNNSYIWCLCAFNVTLIWNRSEDKPVPWLECDRQDCRWWLQQNICPKYFVKIQFRLGQVPIQSWTWQISAL